MKYLLPFIVTALFASCVSVNEMDDSHKGLNNFGLAVNAYNAGDFAYSERAFKAMRQSDSLEYQMQSDAVVYWLASAGRLSMLDSISQYIDSNNIDTDITVPGGFALDLGFNVTDISAWQCFHLVNDQFTATAECWANAGYAEYAKNYIIHNVIRHHSQSRIVE